MPPFDALGGDGIGGWRICGSTTSADSLISVGGDVIVNANGFGGAGSTGGAGFGGGIMYREAHDGFGGGAGIHAQAGSIDITGSITLNSNGVGGDSVGYGGNGGYGEGGVNYVQANGDLVDHSGGNVFLRRQMGSAAMAAPVTTDGIEVFIAAGAGGDGRGGIYDGTDSSGGAFVIADSQGAASTLETSSSRGGTGGAGASAPTVRPVVEVAPPMAALRTRARSIRIRTIPKRLPT